MFISRFFTSAVALFSLASGSAIKRASLQQVTNFGPNASSTQMWIYVPETLPKSPAIIVAIRYCEGNASIYNSYTPYSALADQHGFIVIYPSTPYGGMHCWDVSSTSALTHNGGGDSNSIANMVTYTIAQYKADVSRVFVTGTLSDAMMTNVLAATYPELFAAASVYSGVPAGCFVSSNNTVDAWNTSCAQGQINDTQQQWANVVDNMYPGYTGPRPKMQIYHGSADNVLYPPNYNETIKQWTGVFGVSLTPTETVANLPLSGYTKYKFGPNVQGIYADGVGHTVPVMGDEDMRWFGITS